MSYGILYGLWGGLFALSAVLGFFPAEGAFRAVCMALAAAVFLPPWIIVRKSRRDGQSKHRKIVRNLSLASIGATTALLALNVMSAGWSERMGDALHAALVVISAPMVCGRNYMLSLFLWGILLMGAAGKEK